MYTPEQEFGEVSRQYDLRMQTFSIGIGATAASLVEAIVSAL